MLTGPYGCPLQIKGLVARQHAKRDIKVSGLLQSAYDRDE